MGDIEALDKDLQEKIQFIRLKTKKNNALQLNITIVLDQRNEIMRTLNKYLVDTKNHSLPLDEEVFKRICIPVIFQILIF